MIVVSAGMYKAGSGWYFNLTNDLLVAAGKHDVRVVRERFYLGSILKGGNCSIGSLTLRKLAALTIPHLLGKTFVVKTHRRPSRELRWLMLLGIAKATFIFRDPRDVALSILEHGQRIRDKKPTHIFVQESIESAIEFVKKPLQIYDDWMELKTHVLNGRYEDLLANPEAALTKVADFLLLEVESQTIQAIVQCYNPKSLDAHKVGLLHFNKGRVSRFADVMTRAQLDLCNEHFGDYLLKMGYPKI